MAQTPASDAGLDFLVQRTDWKTCRTTTSPVPAPDAAGQVLFRVDRFAFTSNNVTYALTGDMLGYWSFFPADPPWGRLPVMGFADVIASTHPDVAVGERVFGFFPMSTHLRIDAIDVGPAQLGDGAPHRAPTAPAYRQYLRTSRDGLYEPAREDTLLLLRGLFLTSFLVDDFLGEQDAAGVRTFVLSSASSKTAIALAFLLAERGAGRVVALTSPRNAGFVAKLGCYDAVFSYDAVRSIAADGRVVFVDHAGDAAVVRTVHEHFGDALAYSGVVGATHWDRGGQNDGLPGPSPTFFFAPTQLEKRTQEWGAAGLQSRIGDAWRRFAAFTDGWLRIVRDHGPDAVERIYREVLDGKASPADGHVLSLWPEQR